MFDWAFAGNGIIYLFSRTKEDADSFRQQHVRSQLAHVSVASQDIQDPGGLTDFFVPFSCLFLFFPRFSRSRFFFFSNFWERACVFGLAAQPRVYRCRTAPRGAFGYITG